jgi:hypothetical protein
LFAFAVGIPFALLLLTLALLGINSYTDFKTMINGASGEMREKSDEVIRLSDYPRHSNPSS